MKKITRSIKSQYCGVDKIIPDFSKVAKIPHIGKKYFIRDNGDFPYLVCINRAARNEVTIYKIPNDINNSLNVANIDMYKNHAKYTYLFSEQVHTFKTPAAIFIGKSPKTEITETSNTYGRAYDGNTILLQLRANEYVFIGRNIFTFRALAPIVEFIAPLTHNELAQPFAIDQLRNYYLFAADVVVEHPDGNKLLGKIDPYGVYYKLKRGRKLKIKSIHAKHAK
jgi:hypothetical protein